LEEGGKKGHNLPSLVYVVFTGFSGRRIIWSLLCAVRFSPVIAFWHIGKLVLV